MTTQRPFHCPDCDDALSRRDFVKVLGGAAAVAATGTMLGGRVIAGPTPKSTAETTVGRLYQSLSDQQRKTICFPFEHELRHEISANWLITDEWIGSDFYSAEQKKIVDEIFRGVTSEDGYERFQRQMEDDSGGFGEYSMAIFGEPGTGKFQWELTGRHHTIRADGDSVEGMAFGGPIVYGHGVEDPADNLFHYQTKKANEVFAALDPKQREKALLAKAPRESNVPIQGQQGEFPGIAAGELSSDQKALFEESIRVILAPYRKEDIDEALAVIKSGGGIDTLRLAFYQQGDLKDDKVWDIWRVEGPTFVWHFRGAPHVHAYVHVGTKPAKQS
ncbi:MAG: DUF3500 domain-containing protein [Planctomycetaceae bacterium]